MVRYLSIICMLAHRAINNINPIIPNMAYLSNIQHPTSNKNILTNYYHNAFLSLLNLCYDTQQSNPVNLALMTEKKNTLGVVIITKNEEKNIARCLESVKWADEIIVVDSGSTDKTLEIAQSYGAKTIERHWPGDGPQKHFGISQLTTNWGLVLDADEEVTIELAHSIKTTLKTPQYSFYKMHRRSFFLGKIIHHGDWGKDWIVRLFDCKKHQWTPDIVHAKLDVSKKQAGILKGKLIHHSQDSVTSSLKKMNDYSDGTSTILWQKGKKTSLLKASFHKNWTFLRGFIMRLGFLDGKRGYLIAKLSAYGSYFKYVKLWEKQQNEQ